MHRSLLVALPLLAAGCNGVNVFTLQDDIELGQQLKSEIDASPSEYPVIARADAPEAYDALDTIVNRVLDSGAIEHRDDLVWEFHLIDDDSVVNAFAAPGGYVWIYSGLIRELDNEDSFAGVLAHEVGHADGRHSTDQLTQIYGVSLLLDIVLGTDRGTISQVAESLVGLEFSRSHERDADDRSVRTLCDSPYAADSVALFFEDLEGGGFTFLSTHPSPENRVDDVRNLAEQLDCDTSLSGLTDFDDLRNALP